MIDLHSHVLPGIDDGAPTLEVALEMARMAVADGIQTMACTPHIYPGLYLNDSAGINAARDALQAELDRQSICLRLVIGADVHLVPGLLQGLRAGTIPTLHGSRYVLLEPSHHVAPPRFEDSVFSLVAAGYTPVITHPERLTWIETHYPVFVRLIEQGSWMQITAGALTGSFGPRARYWAERFIGEGHAHILASDTHSTGRRKPCLSEARLAAAALVGNEEATHLVVTRPQAILDNLPPSQAPALPLAKPAGPASALSRLKSLFGRP
ncbi:MAG: CpsB/CapC family capsule biosynthesis tyrosine phosphatase [Pseudomonadota bacterium]